MKITKDGFEIVVAVGLIVSLVLAVGLLIFFPFSSTAAIWGPGLFFLFLLATSFTGQVPDWKSVLTDLAIWSTIFVVYVFVWYQINN